MDLNKDGQLTKAEIEYINAHGICEVVAMYETAYHSLKIADADRDKNFTMEELAVVLGRGDVKNISEKTKKYYDETLTKQGAFNFDNMYVALARMEHDVRDSTIADILAMKVVEKN